MVSRYCTGLSDNVFYITHVNWNTIRFVIYLVNFKICMRTVNVCAVCDFKFQCQPAKIVSQYNDSTFNYQKYFQLPQVLSLTKSTFTYQKNFQVLSRSKGTFK